MDKVHDINLPVYPHSVIIHLRLNNERVNDQLFFILLKIGKLKRWKLKNYDTQLSDRSLFSVGARKFALLCVRGWTCCFSPV